MTANRTLETTDEAVSKGRQMFHFEAASLFLQVGLNRSLSVQSFQ